MEDKVNTIKNFLEEYKRIKPTNWEEFDKKRNAEIIGKADDVMELFDCTSWYWFIAACELPFYIKQKGMDIISFAVSMPESKIKEIFPNCNVRNIIKNSINL